MSKNIYITAIEPHSGKSAVTMGVMEFLIRNIDKVAFFRPIINTESKTKDQDDVINLISTYYNIKTPYNKMFAYTFEEAKSFVARGHHEELLEGILDKYKTLESKHDFVLCLGTDFDGDSSAFEFDLNAEIANNLGCPVLMVANAYQHDVDEIAKSCQFALESFEDKGCNVLSLILNRTSVEIQEDLVEQLKKHLKDKVDLIYSIPNEESLDCLSLIHI